MLRNLIEKNKQNLTTLTTLHIVLMDYIECKRMGIAQTGLTSSEINKKYKIEAERFNTRKLYYSSYIQRHSQGNDLFVERDRKYSMNSMLVLDKSTDELVELSNLTLNFIKESNVVYTDFFIELDTKLHHHQPLARYQATLENCQVLQG